ncbi:unnamed protein product [Oncorhynchus mykiss]|uniref:UBC core domain-containing protein n=1 Tax=Oncorhynchus mykiss TaxID=8022 RepID=A0A060YVI6_ONCMY|nr:unnamed protein product [Oncorhynchus mykiss]
MEGATGTLYEGEKFQLLFKFSSRYPFDSPQVMFMGENIPVHPHVYSNGHICLSILTEDWSPALSVQSVCLSIISMLSSCKEKVRGRQQTLGERQIRIKCLMPGIMFTGTGVSSLYTEQKYKHNM